MDNHVLGRSGEDLARQYLEDQGFVILCQNFQFYRTGMQGRLGEIDLIAFKNNIVHLCEVKTRSNNKFGSPFEQISRKQLKNLSFAYQYFLSKNPKYKKCMVQFNAISVMGEKVDIIWNAVVF